MGVLGPGLAGILAIWLGAREIFIVNAITFVVAGILLFTLPKGKLDVEPKPYNLEKVPSKSKEPRKGARLLFQNKYIRFALFVELVSAMAGAFILVNTITLVKGGLQLTDRDYGLIMAAFGIGATIAAFVSGVVDKTKSRRISLLLGALILGLAISTANYLSFSTLFIFWIVAGLGQSLAEISSETLIGENIPPEEQGKVYGSHFAFSHLWWAISYPIAGFLGTNFPEKDFLYGGMLTLTLLLFVFIILRPNKTRK